MHEQGDERAPEPSIETGELVEGVVQKCTRGEIVIGEPPLPTAGAVPTDRSLRAVRADG